MSVLELSAALTLGGVFYFILSVLICALHVRFDPYSGFSRAFRKRPILAVLYPFAILLFGVRGAIALIYTCGRGAYVSIFELISGRKIYRKDAGYSHYSVPSSKTVDTSPNYRKA